MTQQTTTTTSSSTSSLLTLRAALKTLGAFTDGRFIVRYECETRRYSDDAMARVVALGYSGSDSYDATILTVFDRETWAYTQVDYTPEWTHIAVIEAATKQRGASTRRWRALA